MEDWLDQRLAEDTYLPDDGFTSRVTAQLPETPLRRVERLRAFILTATFALALLLLIGNSAWIIAHPTTLAYVSQAAGAMQYLNPHHLHGLMGGSTTGQLAHAAMQPSFLAAALVIGVTVATAANLMMRRWL